MRAADLLVLNKTDLAAAAPVATALRPLAPRAAVVEGAALPLAVALGQHATGLPRGGGHAASFASVTLRPAAPLAVRGLRAALDALPEGVLRAKGVLPLDGAPALVQRVGRRLAITPFSGAAEPALVLIGTEAVWDAAEALRPLRPYPRVIPASRTTRAMTGRCASSQVLKPSGVLPTSSAPSGSMRVRTPASPAGHRHRGGHAAR